LVEEMQKSHQLTKKIDQLENQSLMADTLAQAKERIWVDINHAITKVLPSIKVIFEQEKLIDRCRTTI